MDGVVIRTTGHVAGGKTDKDIAQYAPYISPDTNTWWQYNKETQMFEDTGIVPYGLKGEKGDPGDDYILTEEDKAEIIAAIRAVVVVNSDTVNGHTVEADVPEDAVFTDTTYDPATQSSTGLMSAQDKTRLDNLQNDALRKTKQTLSAAEKTQARTNIGAIDEDDAISVIEELQSEITITFTADTTYVNNASNIRIRKSLNNVLLQFSANLKALTASNSAYIIGTIPSEYAPAYSVNFVLTKINSSVILLGQITVNGEVQVFNLNQNTAAGWYDGSVMWFNV